MNKKEPSFGRKQNGAVLFIGLIMLLVITTLAVTSMREVSLEARITGNVIEQKRLNNAAESGLREAERRLMNSVSPPDTCSTSPNALCVQGLADTYGEEFDGNSIGYRTLDNQNNTRLERNVRWYVRDATNAGNVQASCPDPEANLTGKGCVNYYEVNSQSYDSDGTSIECGEDSLCIRSTISKIYN